jgi:type IV secretory pathway component VirB8
MAFVFAASALTAVVLVATLARLSPISKTQVFFLTETPRDGTEITISSYSPNNQNIEIYKQSFVKEYIRARNEIVPNSAVMRRRWAAGDGSIYSWSSPEIYAKFADTMMVSAMFQEAPPFEFRCLTEFRSVAPRGKDRYAVSFAYFCSDADNNDRQALQKDYTIVLGLKFLNKIQWADRLRNPLGVQVVEYTVESGNGDPLDFIQ